MFPIPLVINWWRLGAYVAVILLVGLLEYKVYSAGEAHIETQWELSNAKVAQAVAVDNADKAANYEEAKRKADADKVETDAQLAKLGQLEVSKQQTEKDLKNAYSKLNLYRDANGLLWRQTSTNNTDSNQIPPVSSGYACGGEVANATSPRRPNALEISCARETVLYNKCISRLEGLYIQFKQPFYYEQE